ncbi:heavy metal translocating P-type ATPase [Blattabacterium cuenoti]|uniref:heavy metal translocating P-type ATPase n=1 Tax=Blattabacterium cuenoti TaxID=1653831 RepID=UPI00163C4284|nr:HAD-IC family P-type ATPase [Blattabacterium cuenoti]
MNKNDLYKFLDNEKVSNKIIDFHYKYITKVHFLIPSIRCYSCIYILENLSIKNNNIFESVVDFTNKKIWITFNNTKLKLSEIAKLLDYIGYPPSVNFEIINENKNKKLSFDKKLIGKLAISFFCFGNIMLLSIPEYIGSCEDIWYFNHRNFFRYLMLLISLPIVFLLFLDHIKYVILGLKKSVINIDIPIFIGITVLFLWSVYEIFSDLGPGYLDSISSYSLFLSISKLFKDHTSDVIFYRKYKSFYPILITKIKNGKEKKVLLSSLKEKDIILIKNQEIIPADSILIKGKAILDNSFITGESYLVNKKIGDKIYAGSKQKGEIIYLKVLKNVDHSYLSVLWNNNKKKNKNKDFYLNSISTNLSKYFTPTVLLISLLTGMYWYLINNNVKETFHTMFSVLIITCPCALVLSCPLILGNFMILFSKKGFYIKDIFTMEKISKIKTLVFDKTGTLTDPKKSYIKFVGSLKYNEKKMIASLLRHSNHPLSKKILSKLSINNFYSIKHFKEIVGKGLTCKINGVSVKIGSSKYLNVNIKNDNKKTKVAVTINNKLLGYFFFRNFYRNGIEKIFYKLRNYKIVILSGDNNNLEKKYLKSILPNSGKILFHQSPENKMYYIKKLQNNGEKVMMFGDGINDCAALNQSEIGVAVADNITSFFPSCDAFIKSSDLYKICLFLKISKISVKLIVINFMISLLYNVFGIIFAVTGTLKPIVASILMPLSSLSVIIFSIISTSLVTKKLIF